MTFINQIYMENAHLLNSNSSSVSVFWSAEETSLLVSSFLRKRRADREQRAEKDPDNKVLTLFVTRFPA